MVIAIFCRLTLKAAAYGVCNANLGNIFRRVLSSGKESLGENYTTVQHVKETFICCFNIEFYNSSNL